jgi:hypothetical protein
MAWLVGIVDFLWEGQGSMSLSGAQLSALAKSQGLRRTAGCGPKSGTNDDTKKPPAGANPPQEAFFLEPCDSIGLAFPEGSSTM